MATSESTTQPIICCIGEEVAGRPTQFVLERAFDAERMHWQALSVEVPVEKFSLISEATLAMGFRGLRFYDQMEREAGKLLTKVGSLENFVGCATTAFNLSDRWQVWDNRGPAWLSILGQYEQPPASISIWLHGNSIQTRSLFAHLLEQANGSRWAWTDAPVELQSMENPKAQSAIALGRVTFDGESFNADRFSELLGCAATEPIEEKADLHLAIVTASDSLPGAITERLDSRSFDSPKNTTDSSSGLKILVPRSLKLSPTFAELVRHRISEADLAVAGEAYDFYRWTNKTADIGLLRDAYDEYCDF